MKRELTEFEYDQIIGYLKHSGVIEDKLIKEMADHLAILTELYLGEGSDFETSFERAKQDVKQKDLLEISENTEGFKGYPKFLCKKFLVSFAVMILTFFIFGLLMKYQHIPKHRLVIVISRRLISFALLPLLLLYNLTISANKAKQVLQFVFQFSLFQTIAEYLIKQKISIIFLSSSVVFGLIWLFVFLIVPLIRDKRITKVKKGI
jgi:hypothetical protein